jgi:hypothetical protein
MTLLRVARNLVAATYRVHNRGSRLVAVVWCGWSESCLAEVSRGHVSIDHTISRLA